MDRIANLFKSSSQESLDLSKEDLKKLYIQIRSKAIELEDELNALKSLQANNNSTASSSTSNYPTSSYAAKVNSDLDKLIKNALTEIREYDGSYHPGPFKNSARRALAYFNNDEDKATFSRRLVAQKIKGRAIPVVDRINDENLAEIMHALDIAFGQIELNYEQLVEQRNNMRQGVNESIKNYIIRYEEIHIRLQNAIDSIPSDFRESIRYLENHSHIKKFIRSLKPEIELRLLNDKPATLRAAFAEAQLIDKQLRDDEILRSKKSFPLRTQPSRPAQSQNTYSRLNTQTLSPSSHPRTQENNQSQDLKMKTYYCSHCKTKGHSDSRCFILHPELKRDSNFRPRQYYAETPPITNERDCESVQHSTSPTSEEYLAPVF